jgi:hypothetical protein
MGDCDDVEIVSSLSVDDLVWKAVEAQQPMESRTLAGVPISGCRLSR